MLELDGIVTAPKEGYVAVYEWQVSNGLTFPIGELLREVIKKYQISVCQIYPLGICRIMAFEMCCEKAGVTGSVKLFRYFYYIKKSAGGYYFSSRPKKKDFVSKYSEGPVGWKQNVFMVKKSLLPAEMSWKQSVGKDNYQEEGANEEDI